MSGYGDDAVSHGVGVCVGVDDDGYVVVDDGVGGDGGVGVGIQVML